MAQIHSLATLDTQIANLQSQRFQIAIKSRDLKLQRVISNRSQIASTSVEQRGPKAQNPEIPNKKRVHKSSFSKSSREHLPSSLWRDGNCSEKLVQVNFSILGGFFGVDIPPVRTMA